MSDDPSSASHGPAQSTQRAKRGSVPAASSDRCARARAVLPAVLASLAIALAACGGDGHPPPPAPAPRPPLPDSAVTNTPSAQRTNSVPTATPAAQLTASASPTPTPTPNSGSGAPDLVPESIDIVAPTPTGGCVSDVSDIALSLEVCVLNQGDAPAGPFVADLRVAGAISVSFPGAAANSEVCESAPFVDGQIVLDVDADNTVAESDETNNQNTFSVTRPTLPPICATPAPGA